MLNALTRALAKRGSLLPALVLAAGLAGQSWPWFSAKPAAAAASLDPDVGQIDQVLARRAPELGLALRRRVAESIIEESRAAHLDPMLVLGVIEVESEFDHEAVSWAGARGLMQLMPATLEYLAGQEGLHLRPEEIYRDPALQVRVGVRYLGKLEKRFGNLNLALMAYNAGPEKLRLALEDGDVEKFRNYVNAVRRNFARFRKGVRLAQDSAVAQVETAPGIPAVR